MNEPEAAASGADPADGHPRGSPPRRIGVTIVALVVGLAGLAAAIAGVTLALLPRQFTSGQAEQIMAWETAKRWRSWQAGEIFPPTIGYQIPAGSLRASSGLRLTAYRAGTGPQSRCATAADPTAGRVLVQHGCVALLRATYTDATGAFATTVGIAVLPSSRASDQVRDALTAPGTPTGGLLPPAAGGQGQGVHALPVSGTLAARFGNPQRQISSVVPSGPYLIMYASGYTDGRARERVQPNQYAVGEMVSASVGIANNVAARIGAPPPVPHCPGAPGC